MYFVVYYTTYYHTTEYFSADKSLHTYTRLYMVFFYCGFFISLWLSMKVFLYLQSFL